MCVRALNGTVARWCLCLTRRRTDWDVIHFAHMIYVLWIHGFYNLSVNIWLTLYLPFDPKRKFQYHVLNRKIIAVVPFMTSLGPRRSRMGSPSSLRHVILGGGCPVALQTSVAFSFSWTDKSVLVSSYRMSGGTATHRKTQMMERSYGIISFWFI
jgi:hypothetical protein